MKPIRIMSLAAVLLLVAPTVTLAAQDYNSSRSNKSSSVSAPNDSERLLEVTKAEAQDVARSMLAVDQKDGYRGDYEITVTVGISLKRVPRER